MINLKQILEEKNISQKSLADKTGLTESSISRYINGTRTCNVNSLIKIADALNMTLDELIMYKPMNADKIMAQYGFKLLAEINDHKNAIGYYNVETQKEIILDNCSKSVEIISKNVSDDDWVIGIPFGMLKAIQMKLKELRWVE